MPDLKFNAEKPKVTIDPMETKGELRYILEGVIGEIGAKEITLKYAFGAKVATASTEMKTKLRDIVMDILDISKFSLVAKGNRAVIAVPVRKLSNPNLVAPGESVELPIVVKLVRVMPETKEEVELKCTQDILVSRQAGKKDALPPQAPKKEEAKVEEDEEGEEGEADKTDETEDTENTEDAENAEEGKAGEDENAEESEENDDSYEKEPMPNNLYSGLVAIDYGTTNSAVVVRDPRFAAEEVRGQLSSEQWDSLCEWLDKWLTDHLSQVDRSDTDLFVENLTRIVPNADLPTCGTPPDEIKRSLMRIDDNIRAQVLTETLSRLSNFSQEGTAKILKDIAPEVMLGFEHVIDSKSLESQRYFVLELDENAGPGPIPSTLQVVSAPQTEDLTLLMQDTKVDMGARVGLLLRSAASSGADIRQFVISIKRYFGRDEMINIVPAEGGEPIQFPGDTLCRLAYREILTRAVGDIHRRAENGQFQDAEWPCSVVSTFPTSYPSSLRRNLKEILTDLEIREIDTRFDEATAAAIYYIWREVGADPVCGMNGLMARCRKDRHGRSYQNILLYDLGGGTTDIALIQLLYEELPIFLPEDDKGNGGRYFRITPRLLGTTGNRYIGGDLITLWLFRLVKAKFADCLLNIMTEKNIEPPMDSPLNQMLLNLPDNMVESEGEESNPKYRRGALLDWAAHPFQQMRHYNTLNETIIDILIPTRFATDSSRIPNFFTLWEMVEELKKTLGTPTVTDVGSGLATEWPEETELDSGQLFNFIQNAHPWMVDGGYVKQDDLILTITQQDLTNISRDPIKQSLSLAVSLSKARLLTQDYRDRIDRLILSGQSCTMQSVQIVANEVFVESEGVFDYDPANVRFDRESAKTSVALGACIGRYLESVRIDPFNEKTKQMLRDGYDQVELVIENLFTYLSCRLAYDSLVAMVTIFDQGHELNLRSYTDRRPVARTSIHNLRPVQEKFWIYRIDFEGAEPQYLGLINAEAVSQEHGFEDFRKFREEYLVGFEADAELFVRAFFLPRGPQTIVAKEFQEPVEGEPFAGLIATGTKADAKKALADSKKTTDAAKPTDAKKAAPDAKKAGDPKKSAPQAGEVEEEYWASENDEEFEEENFEAPEEAKPDDSDAPQEDFAEEGFEEDTQEEGFEEDTETEKKPKASSKDQEPSMFITHTITSQEIFDRRPVFPAGTPLQYTIQYGDGKEYRCAISEPLPIREHYEFHIEKPGEEGAFDPTQDPDPSLVTRFHLDEESVDEATLICDERGHLVMLTKSPYDITIWADIEYIPQKMDIHYDPFCGHH